MHGGDWKIVAVGSGLNAALGRRKGFALACGTEGGAVDRAGTGTEARWPEALRWPGGAR